jgi:peptide deformylase
VSVSPHRIRTYGDPVLKSPTEKVADIDGRVAALSDQMLEVMYAAPGAGLAANQIGVQRSVFVYDIGDGPMTVINPEIVEADGEFVFEEGCLSVPGLSWDIVRPDRVHLVGLDLDGNEISLEVDGYEGRVFQHELDHLNGILLVERLDEDQRRKAKRALRSLHLDATGRREAGDLGLFRRS